MKTKNYLIIARCADGELTYFSHNTLARLSYSSICKDAASFCKDCGTTIVAVLPISSIPYIESLLKTL